VQTPAHTSNASDRREENPGHAVQPTIGEMREQLVDLSAGLGIVMLPLFLIAIPGAILFLILPAALLLVAAAVPAVVVAALAGPPYLLVRAVRRRRSSRRNTRRRSPSRSGSSVPTQGRAIV
jgi:Flp pilus assembly protein TadB